MTEKLFLTPKIWLNQDVCEIVYNVFREARPTENLPPFENRYDGRIESILSTIRFSYEHEVYEPNVLNVSADILNRFARDQAFVNGNKRMAAYLCDTFLRLHQVELSLLPNELFTLTAWIAKAKEVGKTQPETFEFAQDAIKTFSY